MAFQKGHKINNGLVRSPETRKKISQAVSGKNHHNWGKMGSESSGWKGDNIGIPGVHDWVRRWKGKPQKCEQCGTIKSKRFDWANIDHKYRRVLNDYIRLCINCHSEYDKKNKLRYAT